MPLRQNQIHDDVAIIGMSAMFAGAPDLQSYWQNILNKFDSVSNADITWTKMYLDPNSTENDRIYTNKGGFLGDFVEFNPLEFGIMPNAVDGGNPDQYLALKLARDALSDAGYEEKPFNREKTGIILGGGTYPNRGYANLLQHGITIDQTIGLLHQLCPNLDSWTLNSIRKGLKDSLPPFTPEMSPGLVPNMLTGRIANRLNLMGPNYVVDAACASSLIAIELAIQELLSHRCDMVLTGGVNASTPPQTYMIFCQLGALSRSHIQPFDKSADGTLLGEGLGFLVLKRLADAIQDGDRIYAVIKGVGTSSDGKAMGLLTPRLEGEVLALQRAYENNGIETSSIGLIEAHGTGIPIGDQTEVHALSRVFGKREGKMPHCALGSVKSMISHCIPAAGVAGAIKSALALYHKVLPPTLCKQINPASEIEQSPFYINTENRPWIHGNPELPRRAGVNAFGFGGINSHVILEEYRDSKVNNITLLHRQWPTELLVFAQEERGTLISLLRKTLTYLQTNPNTKLVDLAYTLSSSRGKHRLSIITKDFHDLNAKLTFAIEKLENMQISKLQTRNGIYYSQTESNGKIVFLFPGEGAQYPNMLADLCIYFPKVREWFDFLDETFFAERENLPSTLIFPPLTSLTADERQFVENQLFSMDIGSEAVFTASMALYELLTDFGITCDAMVGHSTGENTALIASGTVRFDKRSGLREKILNLNRIYRELANSNHIPDGVLLSVGGIEPRVLNEFMSRDGDRLHLAMDNCRNQVVLFGSESDIELATNYLKELGGICTRLPFNRAYYTPLFEPIGKSFHAYYNIVDVGPGHTPLYSCATTDMFPDDPDAIRVLAAKQWHSRIRFRETVEKLYADGFRIFIEVGPSSNLTSFVNDILQGQNYIAISSNSRRKAKLEQFQHLLARLFVRGIDINTAPLFAQRNPNRITLDTKTTDTESDAHKHISKSGNILNLNMPGMSLQPELIKAMKDKMSLSHQETDNLETVTEIEHLKKGLLTQIPGDSNKVYNDSGLHRKNSAETKSVDKAVIPSKNSRMKVMAAHFNLMQEFLTSQESIMAKLLSKRVDKTTNGTSAAVKGQTNVPEKFEDAWPFLGHIIEKTSHYLYCERRFDLHRDIFLQDHTLGSAPSEQCAELSALPVIPFTFSMEIIAQAASCLLGGERKVVSMHDLRAYRWLTLDQGELILRIQAKLQHNTDDAGLQSVHVQLFQLGIASLEKGILVFEGEVKLSEHALASPEPFPFELENPVHSKFSDADLYRTGMFHGPRLQGVKHLRQWSEQGIEADIQVMPTDIFFSFTQKPAFITDAGLIDSVGQLVGYWLMEQFGPYLNCFPFYVKTFRQYAEPLQPGSVLTCRGSIHFISEQKIEAGFEVLDHSGRVLIQIEKWQDRYYTIPHHFHRCRLNPQTEYLSEAWMQNETGLICRRIDAFPKHFLDDSWGIWKRVLAHMMLNKNEREHWYSLPEAGPQRSDWLLGRIAAKDVVRQWAKETLGIQLAPVDIEIKTTEMGKPYGHCLPASNPIPDISISHSHNNTVAVLSQPGMRIGIDIEQLNRVHHDDLLVGGAFSNEEIILMESIQSKERPTLIVGLWCAKEAAAKSLGLGLMGAPQKWQVTNFSASDHKVTISYFGQILESQLWYTPTEVLSRGSIYLSAQRMN